MNETFENNPAPESVEQVEKKEESVFLQTASDRGEPREEVEQEADEQ